MTTQSKHKFEAEVSQVLDLVINSLYSNNDIFLRELLSNASDAIDKLRFAALTDTKIDSSDPQIGIAIDKDSRKIIISDSGIGMSQEEMINNLGTIAKSGTKEFMNALKASKQEGFDPKLIGQFGVGFYSAFIVAHKVTVISRKAGSDKFTLWTSEAKGEYETETLSATQIDEYKVADLKQGCKIILELKTEEEYNEYLEEWKIRSIVKEYSNFIEYPIKLRTKDSENEDENEDKYIWETINSQKALWAKNKSEISPEEYKEFYKHISRDFNEPCDWIHYSAEGTNEFTALLYLPAKAPFDMFMPEDKKGLNLYINRVFITNEAELLLPQYLRFVKGLVDSSDLPLNVSRELLQANPKVTNIKKNLVKKILSKLSEMMSQEKEKYISFYKEFAKVLKEGVHLDFANKDKILELLMFESTQTESGSLTSLDDYISRAGESKFIYYITGSARKELENSPYLESLKSKGVEVLFLTDAIDEWVVMSGATYKEKEFKSAAKGELETDDKTKEQIKQKETEHKDLLETLTKQLEANIKEIKFSDRLTETLCCLVADEHAMSANLERLYKNANQNIPIQKRILELNPNHPVIAKLEEIFKANSNDTKIQDYAELIYGQALLLEGSQIPDLSRFTKLISSLML
ncbi:MAG: molecular chaperone HtpG [Candidatus Caenarcaniphilales bacterium]|nr:molecular chaperone HtpG [Candidatus Caenarcaniphilales bacterium]